MSGPRNFDLGFFGELPGIGSDASSPSFESLDKERLDSLVVWMESATDGVRRQSIGKTDEVAQARFKEIHKLKDRVTEQLAKKGQGVKKRVLAFREKETIYVDQSSKSGQTLTDILESAQAVLARRGIDPNSEHFSKLLSCADQLRASNLLKEFRTSAVNVDVDPTKAEAQDLFGEIFTELEKRGIRIDNNAFRILVSVLHDKIDLSKVQIVQISDVELEKFLIQLNDYLAVLEKQAKDQETDKPVVQATDKRSEQGIESEKPQIMAAQGSDLVKNKLDAKRKKGDVKPGPAKTTDRRKEEERDFYDNLAARQEESQKRYDEKTRDEIKEREEDLKIRQREIHQEDERGN